MGKTFYIKIIFFVATVGIMANNNVKEVKITSADGFILNAFYYDPVSEGPGVLLIHQCDRKGEKTGYEELASALVKEGFHVLILDKRGYGKSRDDIYKDFHTQMDLINPKVNDDIEASFQFLISQEKVTKNTIGVSGASCGTNNAITLAKKHSEIKALVFISGSYSKIGRDDSDYKEIVNRPVLAVYSEEDRFKAPEAMKLAFEKSQHPKSKLMVYKNNAHGTPLFEYDPDLLRSVVEWYKFVLLKRD